MTDVVYVLLLALFGTLIATALGRHLLQVSAARQELRRLEEEGSEREERLAQLRGEVEELEMDLEILQMELEALVAQDAAMRSLARSAEADEALADA